MRDDGDPCLPLLPPLSCVLHSLSPFSKPFNTTLPSFSVVYAEDLPEDVKRSGVPGTPDTGRGKVEKVEKVENSFALYWGDGTVGGVYLCGVKIGVENMRWSEVGG